jgi:hypothetical protein
MAINNVRATLILRNDLAETWASKNPILAKGEIGAEIDTGLLKMGDGSTAFNNLNYINRGKDGDGALITTVNNTLTIANYGRSYWVYDTETMRDIEIQETDLSKWPQTLELEIKNGVARWVVPKINYNRTQGKLDGALITLARDPMYSTEATTKNYVDTAIANAIINAPHLKREIVTELPQNYLDPNTIYMIKDDSVSDGDKYKEYLVINNELVQIGDTSVDLSNYMEKVSNATAGNIPVLAADGTLMDSGIAASTIHDIPMATSTVLGGVYSSNLDNHVSVTNLGYLQINRVATDKLYVPTGSEFILNGGGA